MVGILRSLSHDNDVQLMNVRPEIVQSSNYSLRTSSITSFIWHVTPTCRTYTWDASMLSSTDHRKYFKIAVNRGSLGLKVYPSSSRSSGFNAYFSTIFCGCRPNSNSKISQVDSLAMFISAGRPQLDICGYYSLRSNSYLVKAYSQ